MTGGAIWILGFCGPYILRLLKASGCRSSVWRCRQAPVVGVSPLALGRTPHDLRLIPSDFVFLWLNFEAVKNIMELFIYLCLENLLNDVPNSAGSPSKKRRDV